MKINTQSPQKVLLAILIFIFHFSCSKDSDLLKEFVLADAHEIGNGRNVVDDTFIVSLNGSGSIVLDVLKNDHYIKKDGVKIKKTTSANYGEVIINSDNTITYAPNTAEVVSTPQEETPQLAQEESTAIMEEETTPDLNEETPQVVQEETIQENQENTPPVTQEETPQLIQEETPPQSNQEEIISEDQEEISPVVQEETPEVIQEEETIQEVEEEAVDTFTYTTEVINEDQTVTTEEGTVTVIITPDGNSSSSCVTKGGRAGDTGLKTWCWEGITLPEYSGSKGVSFSNGDLVIDSECYERQITKDGNRLKFSVNPTAPEVGSWCSRNYNMRAEIRTAPWDIRHPKGTEEWFGWSYTFGNDYIIDQNNQWLFWQVHHGVVGDSPHTELMVIKDGQFGGHSAGEIYVVNNAASGSAVYNPTGIIPTAGEKLDIVVHAIWNTGSSGLLQIWINGQSVYDKQQVATIYSSSPWGGNAKWGIYKWPWADQSGVQASQQQGITHLETYMGALRIITRTPSDSDYGKDSYAEVVPN